MAFDSIDILKLLEGKVRGFEDDYKHASLDAKTGIYNAHQSKTLLRSHDKWNIWLTKCLRSGNINELIRTRKALQIGMNDLAKKQLNSDFVNDMFIRLTRSIEITAKKIIEKKHPVPLDNGDGCYEKYTKAKNARRIEWEKYLKKTSF